MPYTTDEQMQTDAIFTTLTVGLTLGIATDSTDVITQTEEIAEVVGYAIDSVTNDFLSKCNDGTTTVQQAISWF